MDKYDVIVVGGGMVGAAAANLLAAAQLKVLVIDSFNAAEITFAEAPGLRTSAFNRFSIEILQAVGAWQHVTDARRCAYTGLQTWENEQQPLCFDASDSGVDYLGHILENNLVQQALWQCFDDSQVTVKSPAKVQAIRYVGEGVDEGVDEIVATLDDGSEVSASLIIGSDGANSGIRTLAKIGTDGWQYQQHCMAVTVKMDEQHPPVTWQAFHPSGPRAYLPLFGQYASLVWYDHADRIKHLKQLPNARLSDEITQAFPSRLGGFTVLDKGAFPLTRMHAKHYDAKRIALVGDAAHTINPLAGQGVNLGFKDAAKLAELVIAAFERQADIGSVALLKQYHQARYTPNLLMMSAMDVMYWGFCNDSKVLSGPLSAGLYKLRNLGLSLANKAGPLKHQVMRYAMGL